jgi:hypothetical protein
MKCPPTRFPENADLRRGDVVEVRSLDEIRATLDAEGKLDDMPFMPEMGRYCGQRFRVYRRADKTCVEGYHPRRLRHTVFLEGLRCDGASHDGCQRGCLIFWKTAWLKALPPGTVAPTTAGAGGPVANTLVLPTTRDGRYYCQSTELAAATAPISRWDVTAYFGDLFTGEATVREVARVIGRMVANKIRRIVGRRPGRPQPECPGSELGLAPGEWVEVKTRAEIEATLNQDGKNRGLSFEQEMFDHCGRRYRVAFPIRQIVSEESGKMILLKNTVVLEGVTCLGTCAKNCPRSNHLYWREIWLKRVNGRPADREEAGA